MAKPEPQFFFSLPRLMAKLSGGSAERTEANWLETNSVGTMIHAIVYIFFAHLLLSQLAFWQQVVLLLPLAVLVLLFWVMLFQLQLLIIKAARAVGLLRQIPNSRAQGVLVGAVASGFALHLVAVGSWMRVLGAIWLIAVSLNLCAAVILAFTDADGPAVL